MGKDEIVKELDIMKNIKKYLITEKKDEIVLVNNKQQLDLVLNYADDTNISVPNSIRNIKIFPVYVDLTKPVVSIKSMDDKVKNYMSYKKFLNQMIRTY